MITCTISWSLQKLFAFLRNKSSQNWGHGCDRCVHSLHIAFFHENFPCFGTQGLRQRLLRWRTHRACMFVCVCETNYNYITHIRITTYHNSKFMRLKQLPTILCSMWLQTCKPNTCSKWSTPNPPWLLLLWCTHTSARESKWRVVWLAIFSVPCLRSCSICLSKSDTPIALTPTTTVLDVSRLEPQINNGQHDKELALPE